MKQYYSKTTVNLVLFRLLIREWYDHSSIYRAVQNYTSSAPSPDSTILTPMALIFRDIKNIGVLALIVVVSYVSTMRITCFETNQYRYITPVGFTLHLMQAAPFYSGWDYVGVLCV